MFLSGYIYISPCFTEVQADTYCISKEEYKLYQLVGVYRKSLKLDSIPLSKSLCIVAITHTLDLKVNKPDHSPCNLHSWSKSARWSGCCYKGSKEGECMWKKPSEITNYKSEGYEIAAFYSNKMTAEKALELWKSSRGHNDVICNKGIWTSMKWNAIGVSVSGNYAVIWFGAIKDSEGSPQICP